MNEVELRLASLQVVRVSELNWEAKSHRHRSSTVSHTFPCSELSRDLIPHCWKHFHEAAKNKRSQQGKLNLYIVRNIHHSLMVNLCEGK
jgi:hypothetical protein